MNKLLGTELPKCVPGNEGSVSGTDHRLRCRCMGPLSESSCNPLGKGLNLGLAESSLEVETTLGWGPARALGHSSNIESGQLTRNRKLASDDIRFGAS